MMERTPLGKVLDESWMSADEEVRRICTIILTSGCVYVKDRPERPFRPGDRIWKTLERCGCEIEGSEKGLHKVTVKGARRCYSSRDFVRTCDVN